ncbi:MAG: hypothetical protein IPL32_17650 [Chloracidobacterium sp.]|nr:hypothetical protein [Chloracidobacterium sp.]
MKPLVIYHANCTDGYGAAFAAWLKLGDEAEYLPMNYGESFEWPEMTGREIYILDFSFPREVMEMFFARAKRVVWLDHHKTAFEMWCSTEREHFILNDTTDNVIILDNNKSGALLAWEYFHPGTEVPMLIQHIDDRDRWQWKLAGSAEIHAALSSYQPWSFEQWQKLILLQEHIHIYHQGTAILRAQKQHVERMAKQARECRIIFDANSAASDGASGLAVNSSIHQSEVGHELANASGTYGLVYYISSDGRVRCSLRSNGEYDVSAIASSFGGGGNRNAAGFETDIETLMEWIK